MILRSGILLGYLRFLSAAALFAFILDPGVNPPRNVRYVFEDLCSTFIHFHPVFLNLIWKDDDAFDGLQTKSALPEFRTTGLDSSHRIKNISITVTSTLFLFGTSTFDVISTCKSPVISITWALKRNRDQIIAKYIFKYPLTAFRVCRQTVPHLTCRLFWLDKILTHFRENSYGWIKKYDKSLYVMFFENKYSDVTLYS